MEIKDVENLAGLARIELSQTEKEGLLSDMESILGYVKTIESIKVKDAEAELKIHNVWREDTVESENPPGAGKFSKELIVGQFPDAKDGFLKVKKIL